MSEPNDDSPSDPTPSEANPAVGGPAANNLTRAPRVNPASVFNPKDAPAAPSSAPHGFSEFLAWMKAMEGDSAPEVNPAPAGRTLIPKDQKKFSRRANEPTKPEAPLEAPAGEAARPAIPAAPAAPADKIPLAAPVSVPADFLNVERKRRAKDTSQNNSGMRLVMQAGAFALIVGSFFLGRATVPKSEPAPVVAAGVPLASREKGASGLLPDDLLAKVDESLSAEAAGDSPRALELLQAVKDSGVHLPGIDFRLAVLHYGSGDLPRTMVLLNQSIAAGEEVAASYNLRGTVYNRQGGGEKGIADMQLAAKLDPFNPRFAFFVGEALRRAGKPQAALVALRQALHRLREPSLQELYQLKIRLAQLEVGQEADFTGEMAARLALNPAPLDWVLTAAAVELHRGNISAAAGYLDKAHSLVPERELLTRLRDYYFFSFADNPELARFFAPIKAMSVPAVTATSVPGAAVGPVAPFAPQAPVAAPLLDAPSPIELLKRR